MKNYLFLYLALSGLILLSSEAFSHGTGALLQKQEGDYIIDVDFSQLDIAAGLPMRISYQLLSATSTMNILSFDDVWVRLQRMEDKKFPFIGTLANPEFGGPGMTIEFARPGQYEMAVRFQRENEVIVETIVPFSVLETVEADSAAGGELLIGMGIGLFLGLLFWWVFHRKHKSKHHPD